MSINIADFCSKNSNAMGYYGHKYSNLLFNALGNEGLETIFYDEKELIEKFKRLLDPINSNASDEYEIAVLDEQFMLICFYLYKNGFTIEEFPDSIGRPCDRLSFVDGVLKEATREKLISENRYDKYVPWQERRDFANSLHIKKVGNKINNNTNELIKSISTRSADFNDMTADEKLEALNNAIENLIFVDEKTAFIDESEFFGLATNDQIKKYRKTTQPFRHAKKQMLEKRNAFSR